MESEFGSREVMIMRKNYLGRLVGLVVVIVGGALFLQNHPLLEKQLSAQVSPANIQRSFQKVHEQVNTFFTAVTLNANAGAQNSTASQETSSSGRPSSHVAASKDNSTATDATPVESIVSNVHLQPTYYYEYAASDSPAVRLAFDTAVQTYNATGIVTLKPGHAGSGQNQLTFSTYHEVSKAASDGAVEVGHGGPEIYQTNFSGANATNHGSAKLNTAYLSSYNDAVAIHEVGHALGLDHSSDPNSVMYPVTQGRVQLTSGDIAGLKAIYSQN